MAVGGTLSGKVTDKSDGSPLFKANVSLLPDNTSFKPTGSTTDENGEFTVKNLDGGTYTVVVSSIGFVTVRIEQLNIKEDPNAILITYRNFGKVVYYGTDFSLAYRVNQNWTFGGSYSYISKNHYDKDKDNVREVNLNAPKHKFALQARYTNPAWGFSANTRLRYVDDFEMDSPFFGDLVPAYELVDLNLSKDLIYNTKLSVTIQNLLDNKHIEFVGGAEMGRLAIAKLSASF